jgi:hypothetical protein
MPADSPSCALVQPSVRPTHTDHDRELLFTAEGVAPARPVATAPVGNPDSCLCGESFLTDWAAAIGVGDPFVATLHSTTS